MFEHRRQRVLPRRLFVARLSKHAFIAGALVSVSLGLGILGYRFFEGMAWVDAFLNAAMLMGGMGPVGEIHSVGGKLFAGFYALYCGLVFIVSLGFLLAPVFHRFYHKFHLEEEEAGEDST